MRKKNKNTLTERIGQISKNKYGSKMVIVEYNGSSDVWVQFEKGKPVHTCYQYFCDGRVKNVYDKTVYGIGYLGEGEYKASVNSKNTPQYSKWTSMLQRCYSEKYQQKQTTCKDCKVCEEWHNFQNFAAWYDQNYYEVEGEVMCLDKDILVKRNKVYSPENCVIVPDFINNIFIKTNAKRGNLPIGVSVLGNKFRASCTDGNGKVEKLGLFNTPEEAFCAYKKFKEELIKQTAEKYKNKIPTELYKILINYNVEIAD